jgi:tetratricopeptide (TPR) repeat protein
LAGQAVRGRTMQKLAWLVVAAWLAGSVAIVRSVIPLWHDEAVFFRWAIALAPPNSWPYLYINLGSHYANHDEMAQARDAFAQAVEAKPRSRAVASLAWYNLGNAEEKLGHVDRAKAVLNGALAIDPDNIFARASFARLERMAGRAQAAAVVADAGLQRLRRAGISHPNESMLRYQLGLAYLELARYAEAVEQFEGAVAGARDPQVRAEAGQALLRARTGANR